MGRRLRKVVLVAWGLLAAACGGDALPERVVLVSIDTLRADRVGCYGDPDARTPTVDAVAAAGVRFEHAISPAPLTLPAHTSLLTGLDPPQHGVRHNAVFSLAPDIPTVAEAMRASGFATAAFVAAFVLDARFGLARGFDVYDDEADRRRASRSGFAFAERPADAVVDAALAWLEEAPDRFFLWVHLYDPHADYRPPPAFGLALPQDPYAGEIAFADAQVGRLLAAVRARWGDEGLLVAITSDHGESLGEHAERTHSYSLYDATQRVPLVLSGPGVPAGALVTTPVRLIDVAPTLLARVGAAPLRGSGGRDLLPLVHGSDAVERTAYVETLATQIEMGWSPLLGLRDARYKYVRAPRPELYDLVADPAETLNLAAREPQRIAAFEQALETRLADARPVVPRDDLRTDERERLESLGYLVPQPGELRGGRGLGVVGGADPKDHMAEARILSDAGAFVSEGLGGLALGLLSRVEDPGPRMQALAIRAALQTGDAQAAIARAQRLLAREGPSASILVLLASGYRAAGHVDEARRQLEAAHALAPGEPGPLVELGRLQEAAGDRDEAAESYRRAAALDPAAAPARYLWAALRLEDGALHEADALLARLPQGRLRRPDAAIRLARAEQVAGRGDRALERLAAAAVAHPRHRRLLGARAVALGAAGRDEEALEVWQRVHALDPADPQVRNDLAWGLALAGRDLERALALARSASAALGDEAPALDTLATVHLVRGEAAQALSVADRALAGASAGLRPHLLYVRAAALVELGRLADARQALAQLAREPGSLAPPWDVRAEALAARVVPPSDTQSPS